MTIDIGKFKAYEVDRDDSKIIFCFCNYLDRIYPINQIRSNEGGYKASDLRRELQKDEVLDIFSSVREYMVPFSNGDYIRIPYAEELFGSIEGVEPSNKGQWKLMIEKPECRIALRESKIQDRPWLLNRARDSKSDFALVDDKGRIDFAPASFPYSVRPVFMLKEVFLCKWTQEKMITSRNFQLLL